MFATSWLLTIFTRIVEMPLIYELWEVFLYERDRYFIFYAAVALLIIHRIQILSLDKFEKLLKYLTADMKVKAFE